MEKPSTSKETEEPFGKFASFTEYQKVLLQSIIEVTKAAGSLPSAGQNYSYYSTFPLFNQVMGTESDNILKLMSTIAEKQIGKKNFFHVDGVDMEEKLDALTELNDVLMERAGIQMDIANGVKREADVQLTTVSKEIDSIWNKKSEKLRQNQSNITLLTAASIPRPQVNFPDKIDNSNSIFMPKIKEKPHALKPLAILVETVDGQECCSHPYEVEIEAFNPTDEQMKPDLSKEPLALSDTPLVMVETCQILESAIQEIKKHDRIAIDLEHHSYRSFQGFTCLIQLSTWEKDYIIDPLPLRCELHRLNEITTDPKIVKVIHGAHGDIQWLQRDFGVYVVNMFDTGVAAKLLNYQRLSLSFLLKKFVAIEADKRYQLVDWRVRPLPQDFIDYARTDTHYLLKIYEYLKQELVDASNEAGNLIRAAWQRSSLICLKRYEKPLLTETTHLTLLKTSRKRFNEKQLYALKHMFAWRDRLAREYDESTGFVLPNHQLLHICELLPREMQGIISCCNPCPPLIKQQLNEIHQIILKAREVAVSNSLLDAPKIDIPLPSLHTVDFDNILNMVHDLPEQNEARLTTLLDDDGNLHVDMESAPAKPLDPLFSNGDFKGLVSMETVRCGLSAIKFFRADGDSVLRLITPFERYLKELERAEREQDAMQEMLNEAKEEAQKELPVEVTPEETNEPIVTEEEEKMEEDEPEPEVIRGKKRKRPDPSIPLLGGEKTSYSNTQTAKLEKHKKKDFDYQKAIEEQQASRQANKKQSYQQQLRGRGGSRGQRGGRGNFGNKQRRQFDDMADLQRAESSDAPRGASRRRVRGNRSVVVRGRSARS